MNLRCTNNWLGHEWGPDGQCVRRCGATNGRILAAATSVADQCLAEALSPNPPAGHSSLRDSLLRLLPQDRGSHV